MSRRLHYRQCLGCGKSFETSLHQRFHCSSACTPSRAGKVSAGKRMALATIEASEILARAVAMEIAPPWERHPEPWDPRDFAPRRGGDSRG